MTSQEPYIQINEVIMSPDTVEDPEIIKLFHYDNKPQ